MTKEAPQPTAEAHRIVGEMDLDTFYGFHRELQYALEHSRLASRHSQGQMMGGGEIHHDMPSDKAFTLAFSARERVAEISQSPLYDAVRARIRTEMGASGSRLPKDFTGWTGMEAEDKTAITDAIQTTLNKEMPEPGLLFNAVSDESLTVARRTIEGFGIHGVFVGSRDLVATFHEHWGSK